MKTGLVSISFRQLEPAKVIGLVVETGLQGIEWGGDVHVPHGDIDKAKEVGEMTRVAGLQVASYGSYYRFEECDPSNDSAGPDFESVLETAKLLGAPAIRVWAGTKSPHLLADQVKDAIYQKAHAIASLADEEGIRIDLEYHENTLTETPESTEEFIVRADHPNIRTLWQPPLQMSPENRLAGLEHVSPWVSNIHCNHFDQNPWPDIFPLSEGATEWASYLSHINGLPGDRWILIEHVKNHSPEQFIHDAAALKSWLSV